MRCFGAALIAACLLSACQAQTEVIVVVETDIAVPTPLAIVRASIDGDAHDFALVDGASLPFSFGVVPHGGDATLPLDLVIDGRDTAGTVIVSRSVHTGYRAGRTTLLRVRLEQACLGLLTCAVGETCISGTCMTEAVAPLSLPEVVVGQELAPRDAGMTDLGFDAGITDLGFDAGITDLGFDAGITDLGFDAGMTDLGVDAGDVDGGRPPIPRSCVAVRDAGGASGVHRIDPDGPGGTPPFDVYCENDADGGGWTLIAKVAPMSLLLRYDDPVWMDPVGGAFGDPSTLDTGEALLASYWRLPVSELRLGMTDAAGTRWATATLARTIPLRAAMDTPGAVAITGLDMTAWNTLAGATFTDVCLNAGLGVRMVNASARIGVLVAGSGPCGMGSTAYAFVGFGTSNRTFAGCADSYGMTAGGAQPCGGPPPTRFAHPAYGVVMAR